LPRVRIDLRKGKLRASEWWEDRELYCLDERNNVTGVNRAAHAVIEPAFAGL
jgi:hypothetical protein